MKTEDRILKPVISSTVSPKIESVEKGSLLGLFFIFMGAVGLTICAVVVKVLEDEGVPFIQIIFVRYWVVAAFSGSLIILKRYRGEKMEFFAHKDERPVLIIRAVLYYGALNFYYWALLYIPIGLLTVIGYSFPLLIAVICHWGLISEPEKLSIFGWFCNISGFVGLGISVSGEDLSGSSLQGIFLAVMSTICWAIQIIIIRRTRSSAHWLQIEFITGFVNSVVMTPGILLTQYVYVTVMKNRVDVELSLTQITPSQWARCIIIGCVGFLGLSCYTIGFQLEEAPRGAIVMYLELPLMYIAQWIVFGQGVSLMELCGLIVLICGIMGASIEKIIMSKQKEVATLNFVSSAEC